MKIIKPTFFFRKTTTTTKLTFRYCFSSYQICYTPKKVKTVARIYSSSFKQTIRFRNNLKSPEEIVLVTQVLKRKYCMYTLWKVFSDVATEKFFKVQNNRYKMTPLFKSVEYMCKKSEEHNIQQLRVASLRRGQVNVHFTHFYLCAFLQQQASSSLL